jgi:hypothetical protein
MYAAISEIVLFSGRLDIRLVTVKRDFAVRGPETDRTDPPLCAYRTVRALRAYVARRACCTGAAGHRVPLSTRLSVNALRACGAGTAFRTGGADQRGALNARLSG